MSTAAQIKRIHTLKSKAGLKEHEYRDVLLAYGVTSSKDLDTSAAARLIENLDAMTGGTAVPAVRATGRFAPKLQALWIAGYDLNVFEDRTDRGLLAFVERQTKVSHTAFLNNAVLAAAAIEGLKAWIAREAGVKWPSVADPRASARAVIDALSALLLSIGDTETGLRPYLFGARHGLPNLPVDYSLSDFHALARQLGDRLRARRAAKAAPAKAKKRRAA